MLEFLRKIFMAGFGGLDETKRKIDEELDQYAKKGERLDAPHVEFTKNSFDKLNKLAESAQAEISGLDQKIRDTLDISSQSEIKSLRKEIKELRQQIENKKT